MPPYPFCRLWKGTFSMQNIKIRIKFAILSLVMLVALTGIGVILLMALRGQQEENSHDKVQAITEAAVNIVTSFERRVAKGELTLEQAQEAARHSLRAMRYSGGEYIFATDIDGKTYVHGGRPEMEGRNMIEAKDANGVAFIRKLTDGARKGGQFVEYSWPKAGASEPSPKVGFAQLSPDWQWVIGTGVYIDNLEAEFRRHAMQAGALGVALGGCGLILAYLIAHSISEPLLRLSAVMRRLSRDDLTVTVSDTERGDEIGEMAQAVGVFKERGVENQRLRHAQEELQAKAEADRNALLMTLADNFERSIGDVVSAVTASANDMQTSAETLSTTTGVAVNRSTAAAGAAEEAAVSVNTVAGATEELTASIREISRQVAASNDVAAKAVEEAGKTNALMGSLARAANEVGDVVSLINSIAGQTNLLALNATVEAARAGEHGKGFAVVASEVKSLATQTARATEDIQAKIGEIQQATGVAVAAIRDIGAVIDQMNSISGAIASAVEQQGAATRDIAGNIAQAAAGAQAVSQNVTGASQASSEAGQKAVRMLDGAGQLGKVAQRLRGEVNGFLSSIRAA
jgi:methyl-accepting chemotaxis protein